MAPGITFTATFDKAVTGVAASDFGLASTASGVTTTVSMSTVDSQTYVLSVTVTAGFKNTDFSVTMGRDSGSISPVNAAGTNNGFFIRCVGVVGLLLCQVVVGFALTIAHTIHTPPLQVPTARGDSVTHRELAYIQHKPAGDGHVRHGRDWRRS